MNLTLPSAESSNINAGIIRAAFAAMVKRGHFNICAFNDAAALTGVQFDATTKQRMTLLHCVHFDGMATEILSWVSALMQSTIEAAA